MGAGAPEIADAVPYIRERLPDIPSAPIREPGPARYRFFESVGQFLQEVASDQPRLTILDDVHWADESSLLLLVHLAHMVSSSCLMVLMTYRDNELSLRHPLSRALADLQKQQSFERIWVRGLSQSAVARFIEISAGVEPPENLSRSVHVQTEGNPLFMTEVVRLLVEEGDLSPDHVADGETWSVRIPEGVRVVVGTRLSKLTDEANKVLSAAAVIGRESDMGILMAVTDNLMPSSDDQSTDAFLVDTLENAVGAKVIEEIPGAPGHYRFSHSLIQQTLLEEVSAVRQMQLHASIATAIDERSGPGEMDALSIASHMADAGSLADPDRFARVSLIAGDVALERYAYEEVMEIFERVLAVKEGLAPDSEMAALLHGLGRSQAAQMQQLDAADALTKAFDTYLALGEVSGAIEVAGTPVYSGETGVPDLLSRAIELVASDSREEAIILSQQALNIGNQGDYDGAIAAYGKALSIAEREGAEALEMWT